MTMTMTWAVLGQEAAGHGTGGSTGPDMVVLGLLLMGGLLAYVASWRASIPRVTLLLVVGAVSGPSGFDIVPEAVIGWFPFVSELALAMVGFLLGESFAGKHLKETGRVALGISVAKAVLAAILVLLLVRLAGGTWTLALLLAGIAPASAPAAVVETVHETRARGPLSRTVLEIVAIDDAWGILLFSGLLVAAQATAGNGAGLDSVADGLWQIGGAVLIGGALGLPMAWITHRIRGGEPTLVEAAGFVFLCAGLAEVSGASYLLATMTLGTVVANRAPESGRPFHAIERVREPFLAVFFLLAGFRFELATVTSLGLIGALYVLGRSVGFVGGSWAAGRLLDAPAGLRRRIGWCLFPQAGVAMGLALLAEREVPSVAGTVLPLIIATTILFEVIGPVLLRWQLAGAGESGRGDDDDGGDDDDDG